MNQTGKIVISPQFAGHPSSAFSPHDAIAFGFHDGLAPARLGKQLGYIDVSGQFILPPQFDEARAFREGRVAVKTGEQWEFIDTTGKSVTPPQFDITQANSFGLLNQAQSLFGKALHENAANLF
ncbi:MAG TPA: WG repeat-containing protein [Stenomitos sp.]